MKVATFQTSNPRQSHSRTQTNHSHKETNNLLMMK